MTDWIIYFSIYFGLFISFYYILHMISFKEKRYTFDELKNIPKVSIIIPAFNEEKGIAQSIMSAKNVDYPKGKLEIIVVDDGSTDRTYSIAKKFSSNWIKVFKMKKNSGKGAAMNYAISKTSGEIIVTMDADNTIIAPDVLKKMVPYFINKEVMCVSPSMLVHNPRKILERIQQIEYGIGVYLRKAFRSVNGVHITPGAFSAYRKSFFDKYGGFKGIDTGNLTEDLEMSLRIQYHGYVVENVPEAVIHTIVPNKFIPLMKQRRRWYGGMVKNYWDYRKMISRKYGDLGIFVLPTAIIGVIISMILVPKITLNALQELKRGFINWRSINFLIKYPELSNNSLFRIFYLIFSDPMIIFSIIFLVFLVIQLIYLRKKAENKTPLLVSVYLFLFMYTFLFAFWWFISLIYITFNKNVKWR